MKTSRFFSEKDLQAIEIAVKEAEKRTSGEIVPVFVTECRAYPEAGLRAGLLLGLTGALLMAWLTPSAWEHRWWHPWDIVGAAFAGAVLGLGLTRVWPAWLRFWAGREALSAAAWQTARDYFLSEEAFVTRDRTGIVLLVARQERKVVVYADKGISGVTEPSVWQGVVSDMVQSVRAGKYAEGLVKGIEDCALILESKGVAIRPDDTDELPNTLRIRE